MNFGFVYPTKISIDTSIFACQSWQQNPNHQNQWPFQDPKLEVLTIYKAYVRPKFQGISPENMALYGTVPFILGSWNSH